MAKVNILLIRGLSREFRHWGDFPDKLATLNSVEKINFLDLPGAGTRHLDSSPLKINDYVEDLRFQFNELRSSEETWVVFAVSLGAMVALEWAHRYPNDFSKLIILNISAKNLGHPLKRLSFFALKTIFKGLLNTSLRGREELIFKLTSNKELDEVVINRWMAIAESAPVKIENFFKQLFAAAKFKVSSNIKSPCLLLVSKNDKLAHFSNSVKLNDLLEQSSLSLNHNGGHDLVLDDPDWVLEKVDSFLKEAH